MAKQTVLKKLPKPKAKPKTKPKPAGRIGIGAHVSIAGGYCEALARGQADDLDAIQIFTSSPRSRARRVVSKQEKADFITACAVSPIRAVYVHTPYYVNAASPDSRTWHFSQSYIVREIELMDSIGAGYFVMHVGSHLGSGVAAGKDKVIRMLDEVLQKTKGSKVVVCLENTAGQKNEVGSRFEDMGEIMGRFKKEPRIGAVMDTCHMFSAGYDIRTPAAVKETFSAIERLIGWQRIPMLHFNDSMVDLGGHRDRHQNLGQGYIGYKGLAAVVGSRFVKGKDLILETADQGRAADIAWLKKTVGTR